VIIIVFNRGKLVIEKEKQYLLKNCFL